MEATIVAAALEEAKMNFLLGLLISKFKRGGVN